MNILMAASEMAPFAQTGKLADAMQSLTEALRTADHEVSVVLPYYRSIRDSKEFSVRPTKVKFSVPVGEARFDCEIYETRTPSGGQVFLVARDEFFDRSGLYGSNGRDYQDNAARFTFFNKCVLELARRLNPAPDVIHAHDWQAALLPVLAKHQGYARPVVLTVHDLAYQGNFWSYDFGLTNLPADYFSVRGLEFFGSMNFLKGGIVLADRVILASERLVRDAQTKGGGCGLEAVLREQAAKLVGIPEGLEPTPRVPYAVGDRAAKAKCREQWLASQQLQPNPLGPVYALSFQLVQQQGFDLVLPILDRLLANDARLVIVGPGKPENEMALRLAARQHAGRLAWIEQETSEVTSQLMEGSDVLLAPAPVEPSGRSIREALHYGVLPVAMAAGGLPQLVPAFEPSNGEGVGFVFYDFTAEALLDAARWAGTVFAQPECWDSLVTRAMETDVSWSATARQLEGLYEQLLGRRAMAA